PGAGPSSWGATSATPRPWRRPSTRRGPAGGTAPAGSRSRCSLLVLLPLFGPMDRVQPTERPAARHLEDWGVFRGRLWGFVAASGLAGEAALGRPDGDLRARAELELGQDAAHVRRDGAFADEEGGRDRAVRLATRDQAGDLALAAGQAAVGLPGRAERR